MIDEDSAWTAYRSRFSDVYDQANYSANLQGRIMRASHVLVERPFTSSMNFKRVLEIGAGSGEHVQFVMHSFDEYVLSDNDPAALNVARRKLVTAHPGKLRYEIQEGDSLSFPSGHFDRVVAVHVLEHIYKPHIALREWARVIGDGGILSVLIPTDPGLAWRLGRHFGPRRRAMSQGIAYDYIMAREHVNSCNNLVAILRHQFPEIEETWWPFRIPSVDLNLFCAFHARIKTQSGK